MLIVHFRLMVDEHEVDDDSSWGPFRDLDEAWDFYRDHPALRVHQAGFDHYGAGVVTIRDPATSAARAAELTARGLKIPTEVSDPRVEWAEASRRGVVVPERVVRRLLGDADPD